MNRPIAIRGTAVAIGAGVIVALAVDLLLTAIIPGWWPALLASLGAVVGLLVMRHHLVAGAVLAATASLVVSVGVPRSALTYVPRFGLGTGPGVAEMAILAVGVVAAVRSSRRVDAVIVVVSAGVAIAGIVGERAFGPWRRYMFVALVLGLVATAMVGLALRAEDARNRADARAAVDQERAAIARELHDVVAHHVTAAVIRAQAAQLTDGDDPARLRSALADIERTGAAALASMRTIVGSLRDAQAPLAPTNPIAELRAMGGGDHGPPSVEVTIDPELARAPMAVQLALLRIAGEAVTNARRHAVDATTVSVVVRGVPDGVDVDIVDDGRATGRRGRGFGLIGMQERVDELNGHLVVEERPGGGWRVHAHLPAARPTPADDSPWPAPVVR